MKYEISLLNKFTGLQLSNFLENEIEDYKLKLNEIIREISGKEAVNKVLTDFFSSLNKNDSEDLKKINYIEEMLFNFLFFQDQNTYYHKKIVDKHETKIIIDKIKANSTFSEFVDRKLYDADDKIGLVSIREHKHNILLLFNGGIYTTPRRAEEKQFLVSCRINLKLNILSIGIKDQLFSKIREEDREFLGIKRHDLVKNIVSEINKINTGIQFVSFQNDKLENALYQMFTAESEKAIGLIKNSLEEDDNNNNVAEEFQKKAEIFLKEEFLLSDPEKFVERTLALKYQDQAEQLPMSVYTGSGGYIFGFSFVEKQVTRSDNKSDKKEPIFKYKLFWNLREIIDDYHNLSQISMYWKFNRNEFDRKITSSEEGELLSTEVEYKTSNNELVLHYFVNSVNSAISETSYEDRKLREDYALRQIIKYISEE